MRRVLLATVTLFVAFPAGAQSKALAEAAFKEARRLVRQGKVAEACPKFEASLKLDPAPGTQLNLADCYARLGRTASAWAIFVEVAEKDTKAARAAEARRRAKALEPKLSRLTVSAENADGLRVTRDGEDITALLGVAVPVDPGRHVVAATRGGDKWSEDVAVGDAASATATVPHFWKDAVETTQPPEPPAEPRPVPPAPAPAAPAPEAPPAAPESGRDRTWAWIVGGVGVAAVATGLVFGGIAKSRWDSSRDLGCHDNAAGNWECPPGDAYDKATSAKSAATASTVFVVAGGAALVGGGVLWFVAPRKTESPVSVVPAAAPGELGVVVRGRF
ncbi:MAG TPA: hypothetical protein VKE22_01820 [Haliangiales bacterium]|nr:hypothetical protein [Haliangiales bacterium]